MLTVTLIKKCLIELCVVPETMTNEPQFGKSRFSLIVEVV